MIDLNKIIRPNILDLSPYSSARDEYKGKEAVFMDANENPFNAPYNRYPDPLQMELKEKLAKIKSIESKNIFLGNGSDEAIDLIIRIFCEPKEDNIISISPSYGMYKVCADINNIELNMVALSSDFQPNVKLILKSVNENTKLIFLCSPNNPTSNSLNKDLVIELLNNFNGIVVIDEAYIDFSIQGSFLSQLDEYPNLIVLQTFSKAWGLAGIRLGMAFAQTEIIQYLNKVKYPYNVNILTQKKALEYIAKESEKEEWVKTLLSQRAFLEKQLLNYKFVKKIYPSDANFILVKMKNARDLYHFLIDLQIIVRDRSNVSLCIDCLRITVGTPNENEELLNALNKYKK